MFYRDHILHELFGFGRKRKDPWEYLNISKEEYDSIVAESNKIVKQLGAEFSKIKEFKVTEEEDGSIDVEHEELVDLAFNKEETYDNMRNVINRFESLVDKVLRSFEKKTKYECEPKKYKNRYFGLTVYPNPDVLSGVTVRVGDYDDSIGYVSIYTF